MALKLLQGLNPFQAATEAPMANSNAQMDLKDLMRSDHPMTDQEITEAMRWINPGLLDICRWSFTWGVRFAEARYNINN